jgi:hypothetical protein
MTQPQILWLSCWRWSSSLSALLDSVSMAGLRWEGLRILWARVRIHSWRSTMVKELSIRMMKKADGWYSKFIE